jgi:hypothetical protein
LRSDNVKAATKAVPAEGIPSASSTVAAFAPVA